MPLPVAAARARRVSFVELLVVWLVVVCCSASAAADGHNDNGSVDSAQNDSENDEAVVAKPKRSARIEACSG
jgi:hypothetical protein